DFLEVIEIEHDDRQLAVVALGEREMTHAELGETATIFEARQHVGRRLFQQQLSARLKLADRERQLLMYTDARQQLECVHGSSDKVTRATGKSDFTCAAVCGRRHGEYRHVLQARCRTRANSRE